MVFFNIDPTDGEWGPVEEFIESEGHLPQEISEAHPFYDDYWRAKVPDLQAIDLPMLLCASFSDQVLGAGAATGARRVTRVPGGEPPGTVESSSPFSLSGLLRWCSEQRSEAC